MIRSRRLGQYVAEIFVVDAEGSGDSIPKELTKKRLSGERVARGSCLPDGVAKKRFGAVPELFQKAKRQGAWREQTRQGKEMSMKSEHCRDGRD